MEDRLNYWPELVLEYIELGERVSDGLYGENVPSIGTRAYVIESRCRS